MKTKILVLGSTGMLGHMVLKVLSKEETFEVMGTHLNNRDDPFYFDAESGLEKLDLICEKKGGYDYFINCIGITKDRIDEKSSESIPNAIRINSIFPHQLAEFAKRKDVQVIHISTDGVFSGAAECYDEDAPHDCTDVYGKTKSLGEVRSGNFLNIRCSIIGPSPFEKRGLFEWFYSQPEGSEVPGYINHLWNGVSTFQFAELCQKVIKDNQFNRLRDESWIFHFVPNQPVSKYELLNILKSTLSKNITINPIEHRDGRVKRVLVSKYKGLKELHENNIPMEKAIKQLVEYVAKR